jgi:hypothetical protein
MVHQNPFGRVNQWGMPVVAPTFTPSPYIRLQTMTSTPIYTMDDAPPSSLMDSTVNPKAKIREGEGIGVCSLARSTSGVKGHAGALGWD